MRTQGFTLVELLVVITILAILAAIAIPGTQMALQYAKETKNLSNMRQIGIGLNLYSEDNNNTAPKRGNGVNAANEPNMKWPAAVAQYIGNSAVFVDSDDPESVAADAETLISNSGNRTAFLMNGFNDLGAYNNNEFELNLSRLTSPASVILLGQKKSTSRQYYMDFVEGPNGNQNDVLNKTAFGKGSNYVFADGSARFIRESDYSNDLWVVNKSYQIPTF